MKQFTKTLMLSVVAFFLMVGNSMAVPLPAGDFAGGYSINLDSGALNWNSVKFTGAFYLDGSYSNTDTAVGSIVETDFAGWSYNSNTDTLFISADATNDFSIGDYLSGTLTDYKVTKFATGIFVVTSLLSEMDYNIGTSQFFQEFEATTLQTDLAQVMSFEIRVGEIQDGNLLINTLGKVAPVPEPTQMLLFGSTLIGLASVGRKKLLK